VAGPSERASVGITGFIVILVSLYGAAWSMLGVLIAAQRPDPEIPDGDPCCPHPDTWHEVAQWSCEALTVVSIDALVFTVGVACALFARHGCWPRWRRLRLIALGATTFTAALMGLALLV
jgi:hypothetical protein